MKVLHFSEQPAKPSPYIHVGYLSARAFEYSGMLSSFGVVMVVAGLVGASSIGKQAVGKLVSEAAAGRTIKMLSFFSGVTAIIGVLFIVQPLPLREPGNYKHPQTYARIQARAMARRLIAVTDDKPLSTPPGANSTDRGKGRTEWIFEQAGLTPQGKGNLDGWDRPYRIESRQGKDMPEFSIRSAGADGKFDTEDDIVVDTEEEKKP